MQQHTLLRRVLRRLSKIRVSGSTPTPWSGPLRDHGLNPPLSTENPRNKGFSGSGAPIFGFGLADPRPRGRGRPLFADKSKCFLEGFLEGARKGFQ